MLLVVILIGGYAWFGLSASEFDAALRRRLMIFTAVVLLVDAVRLMIGAT